MSETKELSIATGELEVKRPFYELLALTLITASLAGSTTALVLIANSLDQLVKVSAPPETPIRLVEDRAPHAPRPDFPAASERHGPICDFCGESHDILFRRRGIGPYLCEQCEADYFGPMVTNPHWHGKANKGLPLPIPDEPATKETPAVRPNAAQFRPQRRCVRQLYVQDASN